jgi:hypothetical protein
MKQDALNKKRIARTLEEVNGTEKLDIACVKISVSNLYGCALSL